MEDSHLHDAILTLEQFAALVEAHDLTYQYSDDHCVWERGQSEYWRIRNVCKQFPREDVVRIWNAAVTRKLVPEARAEFYWSA
jgi:hypothetical protein